tara:strand:- start:1024 stop:1488 length:465 start_codon:yes stop_codon:yes gene_type:complete
MINKDKLVEGPFGSNACYEQTFQQDGKDVTTWMCFGSGFTTSTLMEKDSTIVKNTLETSPELYKDLMHIDKNNRVWFPSTITLPAKGMVFADGTDKDNWKWAAVKAIELTEEDKKSGKFPKEQTHKMDMNNAKYFEAKRQFMDALEVIGFYDVV